MYAMVSKQALAAFRASVAAGNNPRCPADIGLTDRQAYLRSTGAFDVSTPQLKRDLRRTLGPAKAAKVLGRLGFDDTMSLTEQEQKDNNEPVEVDSSDPHAPLVKFLKERGFSDEDISTAIELCNSAASATDGESGPPPFRGMPKPGGTMVKDRRKGAMDRKPTAASAKRFLDRYPDAVRIGMDAGYASGGDTRTSAQRALDSLPAKDQRAARRVLAKHSGSREDFLKRYPGAEKIGIV
jgi:hypothetical protein